MVVRDDQLWLYMGGYSPFAVVTVLLKGAMNMVVATADLSANFMSPYLDYWCNVSSLEHLSQADQQRLASPDGDSCHTFNISWDNYTDDALASWNWSSVDLGDYDEFECQHGWVFDNTTFPLPTATSEVRRTR